MAGVHFVVDVRGLDQLHARLQPGRLLQPTKRFIHDLAEMAQRTAQRAAKPHPADKGTLGRAISIEFDSSGDVAKVSPARNIAGIAFTIEEGRRPGRRPPYTPIKRWLLSHGIISGARGESRKIQFIREEIKMRGTRGVHFMAQAAEVTQRALREGIPRTEAEIHAAWERGS